MKQPHLRSYDRVNSVVTRDRALSKKLSGKTQRVELSNGKSGEYPKEIAELVQVIHNNNLDAVTLSPGEILRYAMQFFGIIDGPLELDKKPAPEKPAEKPEKPAKVEKAEKPAEATPAPKRPKRAPRPVAVKKPAPVAKPADPTPTEPEEPSPVTPEEQETNQVDDESVDEPVRDIIKLPKEWDRSMPYAPGLTICSLLVSALGLADAYDRGEGHAERTKEINAILIKYQRITTIPKSSAKEAVIK